MSEQPPKNGMPVAAAIVIAIVSLGIGIAIGRYVIPNKPAGNDQFAARMGNGQFGGQFAQGARNGRQGQNANFINGELVKVDASSLSVKLRDGSTKLILVTSSTKAMKTTEGSLADFAVGQQVMVTGSTNSDGSITAQTVSERPAGMPGGPPGAQPPAGQPALIPPQGQ